MNGQRIDYKKYQEQLDKMSEPVMPSKLPKRELNLKEIARYMRENNIDSANLSEDEKEKIILHSGNK